LHYINNSFLPLLCSRYQLLSMGLGLSQGAQPQRLLDSSTGCHANLLESVSPADAEISSHGLRTADAKLQPDGYPPSHSPHRESPLCSSVPGVATQPAKLELDEAIPSPRALVQACAVVEAFVRSEGVDQMQWQPVHVGWLLGALKMLEPQPCGGGGQPLPRPTQPLPHDSCRGSWADGFAKESSNHQSCDSMPFRPARKSEARMLNAMLTGMKLRKVMEERPLLESEQMKSVFQQICSMVCKMADIQPSPWAGLNF